MITSFLLAIRAISRNGVRTALTVLGILIGVASLVAVTTLGAGVSARVSGSMQQLSSSAFVVGSRSAPWGVRKKLTRPLSEADARQIERDLRSVDQVAPILSGKIELVHRERSQPTMAYGTTLAFFKLREMPIAQGVFWTPLEEARKEKVCVLGGGLAEQLFPGSDPIGQIIRVKGFPCRVAGVLDPNSGGVGDGGEDLSNSVFMPIGSYRARIGSAVPNGVDQLLVSASGSVERAQRDVRTLLRQRHRIPPGAPPDFYVSGAEELQQIQLIIAGALSALLLCVASVSLIVGGIGVMNIMLVSVAERTREIGIRISIGATSKDILSQFLIEAIVLTSLGGVLGITLGVVGSFAIGKLVGFPLRPSPVVAAVAALTSGLIGVVFGYLPARRAALLDPIQALRSD